LDRKWLIWFPLRLSVQSTFVTALTYERVAEQINTAVTRVTLGRYSA